MYSLHAAETGVCYGCYALLTYLHPATFLDFSIVKASVNVENLIKGLFLNLTSNSLGAIKLSRGRLVNHVQTTVLRATSKGLF